MKRTPNYEISKRELSDYLNDRMGTHYEIFEKSKIERSPPRYTKNQLRMAMTSPKDKQINSMHTIKDNNRKNFFNLNMGFESEKIYEDLIISKKTSHFLKDENVKYRTKNLNLEKQIIKYEKIVQELERSGVLATSINQQQINENMLIMNLKKKVQDLSEELNFKQEEINLLKKRAKFTNHQLLEIENKNYFDEFNRLKKIIFRQNQKIHSILEKDKELIRIISSFENESRNLFKLKQENETFHQNVEFLKEENSNLQYRLERVEKENNFIDMKKKNAILQKENLNLKSSLFNYEEKIKELNTIIQSYNKSDKSKNFEGLIKERDQNILTLENHILEQKNLLENERQTSHELKEQIKKIQSQEKKLDEKPKGKSDSNKQQKMVEIIPIQKEELDCVLEAIRLKFLENSLNLISIEKVFSEKFKISVNEKKKNDQELLVKILIGEPFFVKDQEDVIKLSKYLFQNSKSQEFKEYSNILKELLEPYETLKLEEYEQIKETFLEILFYNMENIINLFETETLSQSNLKRMTVKKIIQLIGDPNLFIYYDLILLELANVKDSEKKLTEKFNDYFQTQQNKLEKTKQIKKNNELSLEKEPTPENLIVKKENSSQMENNQEEKEIYPEENNFQEQNKEYENYENKMISSELQKVDSLENFNKQLNEKKSDIHDDNYFSENNKFSEKNIFEKDEGMNTIQKFEEELNNDLNNQMQLNSNEDIEKINESFPSYY